MMLPRYKKSVTFVLMAFPFCAATAQTVAMFSADLLRSVMSSGQDVDLSHFEQGLSIPPGIYEVSIYLNRKLVNQSALDFQVHDSKLVPVLNKSFLQKIGVQTSKIDSLKNFSMEESIFPITAYIPDAQVEFDGPNFRLDLTVPQLFMKSKSTNPYDVVDPQLWDYGITAGLFNYSMTASHYDSRLDSDVYNQNLNFLLNGQFNLGAWRLFTTGSFSYLKSKYGSVFTKHDWDFWNTYLQRDLPSLHSTMKLGDINTSSDLFDSFSMRGISLGTNEQMLPYANRAFMPTITGFANSFAQVFVKQNDRIVYQTNVPPGPWKLDNLPILGNEGDLTVVVREADGTERVELVPYTSVPLMLREDQFRYDFNIGKYYQRDSSNEYLNPWFGQITASYGLPWNVTLLGGVLFSTEYQAYALGTAFSLGRLGAMSFDLIHSRVSPDEANNSSKSGTAYRVRYEKSLMSTGTTIHLASYRYMTENYYSFSDLQSGSSWQIFDSNRMKYRWQLSMSQTLGKWGQINASGNYISYYDNKRASKTLNVSYGKSFDGISTRLSYEQAYEKVEGKWQPDKRVMVNVNIPLSKLTNERTSPLKSLTTEYQAYWDRDGRDHDSSHRVSLRYANPNSDWYWRVSQVLGERNTKEFSTMLGYDGDRLGGNLSYTRTPSSHSYMLATNGGVVFHPGGVTLSSRVYDSIALVQVPNVSGVKINQSANVLTDSNGYAVITNLRNYAMNELVIDPTTLPEGALLLKGTNQVVYPTSRAITQVVYPVRLGKQALIYLYQENGLPLPFGVSVVLEEDENTQSDVISFVGDKGRTYFSGLPLKGHLKAKWKSNGKEIESRYPYQLPETAKSTDEEFVAIPQVHLLPENIGDSHEE